MRKTCLLIVVLVVVFCFSGCAGGGISLEEYETLSQEYDALSQENANLQGSIDALEQENEELRSSLGEVVEMLEGYVQEEEQEVTAGTALIMYKTAASILSEEATCVVLNEDTVQITVPLNGGTYEDFSDELSTASVAISMALGEEYSSCIIMFLDESGRCEAGFSIADNHATGFLSVE